MFIALVASWSLVTTVAAQTDAAERPPGLTAPFLYNGVNRPVLIEVVSPRSFGTVGLALMDADGRPLAPQVDVHPGRVDLVEKLPAIWEIRRTAYLQMLDGSQPAGAPLVLQPMLSRMVPLTRIELHPTTGQPHSKIVGWLDENSPAAQAPPTPPRAPAQTAPAAPEPAQDATDDADEADEESKTFDDDRDAEHEPPAAADEPAAPVDRLFTGLRIYVEQDVILHTTKGDIRLAMRPDQAPNTAWNFLELSRGGFYRDIAFHRVVKLDRQGRPFVIQAGDPTGGGDGGPGYWLPIENSKLPHDFGVISMARSDDPDSNGSQFFIGLSREGTERLDGQYCEFGYAVDGAAAIIAIAEVELADVAAGRPVDPPLISSAELIAAPPRIPGKGRPDAPATPQQSKPPQTRPSGRIPR